jgi:ABC-type glycerol-3-phosphate transport system substrate-binding protein
MNNKNSSLFQYIFIGAFVFFILIGMIMFATYKSNSKADMTINISVWGTLPGNFFQNFASGYFSDNDMKNYTVDYVEKDSATFDQELVEAIASGVGPDAIVLPDDLIVRYSNKIYPIPYTVLPEISFKDTFIQQGELYLTSSGIMALPLAVDPLVMYWNRDIFNNNGVTKAPATWTDVANLVPKMTRKDQAQNILSSTVALGEYRNVNNAKDIISALFIQSGNPIVSLNSDGNFFSVLRLGQNSDSDSATLALQFFTNFSNPSKSVYSWNRSMPNSLDVFANGDLALYFGFASEFTQIKQKNPNLNFGVALLPQISGVKTISTLGKMLGLAILKSSSNPSGAYTIMTHLTSAAAVPYWNTSLNLPSARRDILGLVEDNAIKTIFNKSAIISKDWYDPNRSQTNKIFQEMVESFTTGRENISSAINIASEKLGSLLK